MEENNLDTNCPMELMSGIALKLMEINNILYPKLDCMPMADEEEMGRLKMTYHALSSTQSELMEFIREQHMGEKS